MSFKYYFLSEAIGKVASYDTWFKLEHFALKKVFFYVFLIKRSFQLNIITYQYSKPRINRIKITHKVEIYGIKFFSFSKDINQQKSKCEAVMQNLLGIF